MASSPQYAATVQNGVQAISVANTNRNGTGTITDILTGGAAGTRIDDVAIVAAGVTTAGVVRLFINNGVSSVLWKEIMVAAITPSTTVPVWSAELTNLALVLKSGWKLQASTHNAETFNVIVTRAGDM
jgi:hypothetical protein